MLLRETRTKFELTFCDTNLIQLDNSYKNSNVLLVICDLPFFLQVFAMLNLTPYDLSVDTLDVHAVSD